MKISVITLDNKPAGECELLDSIFATDVREDILNRMVNWQLAKRRSGNHKVKNRAEINRTSKKIGRQKGGGVARHGSARVGQFRGGGRAFGPLVRSHEHSLTKKFRALALRMALSAKFHSGNLIVVDAINPAKPKTQEMVAILQGLGILNGLIIGGAQLHDNAIKAVSNIMNVDLLPVQGINVYDILRREKLVLSMDAIASLHNRFNKE